MNERRKQYKLILPRCPEIPAWKPGEAPSMVLPIFPTEEDLNHWAEQGYVVEFASPGSGAYLMAKDV